MVRIDGDCRAQQLCDSAASVIISRSEQSLFRSYRAAGYEAAAGHFAPRGTNRYPGSEMMKVAFGGGGNGYLKAAATTMIARRCGKRSPGASSKPRVVTLARFA
jgi:hypothetical protein